MKQMNLVNIPPHSLEAEASVLGNLIRSPYLMELAVGHLQDGDFYRPDHGEVYRCLKKLYAAGVKQWDLVFVAESIAPGAIGDREAIFSLVAELCATPYSETCLESHIALIATKGSARRAISLLANVQAKFFQLEDGALDFLRNELVKMETQGVCDVIPYSQVLAETLAQIEIESESGNSLVGISSGWENLDFYTNGFQPGQLIVIGARPSVGKSLFMLNMAEYVGINLMLPSVVFSLEMSNKELTKRTLSRCARVRGIFQGKVTSVDWEKIQSLIVGIHGAKLFINDRSGVTTSDIRTYCRKVRSQNGKLGAIFVDYLGLMGGEGENETIRLGNITRELKILAKDLEVPIILLSQLNRESAKSKESTTPRLVDLRQSGCIEQDADVVLLLERALEDKVLTVHVAKNRNGASGKFELRFNSDYFDLKETP